MERGHHAKWNNLRRTKTMFSPLYVISQKKKRNTTTKITKQLKLIDREQIGGCQKPSMMGSGESEQRGWKAQTSSDYTSKYCIAPLKVAERVDLKCSHHKKTNIFFVWCWRLTRLIVMIGSQYTQASNYYVYTVTNILLYVNFTSIKKCRG